LLLPEKSCKGKLDGQRLPFSPWARRDPPSHPATTRVIDLQDHRVAHDRRCDVKKINEAI